jgi:hypothetical protein
VTLLLGGVMPADLAYDALIKALGDGADGGRVSD